MSREFPEFLGVSISISTTLAAADDDNDGSNANDMTSSDYNRSSMLAFT